SRCLSGAGRVAARGPRDRRWGRARQGAGMPVLEDFLGDWRLARTIDDRRAGEVGRFDGTARITGDGIRAVYEETGLLRLPGRAPMTATRRHLWTACATGVAIAFADGRAFHH